MIVLIIGLCFANGTPAHSDNTDWRTQVASYLPLLGHRNWIAIVNSAYPLQTSAGIKTIVANTDQGAVVKEVVAQINASRHVRPVVFTDAELKYVSEKDAPGVSAYRSSLTKVFGAVAPTNLPHEQIISKLDDAGKTFNILIIKTNMTIPYTSVFIQLNCKYWGDASEKKLRDAISAQATTKN